MNLIFCMTNNNLIGLRIRNPHCEEDDFIMPWGNNNKEDLKYFKQQTVGGSIIMGYNTWLSIGKHVLPDRKNIIVTNNHYDEMFPLTTNDFKVFRTTEEALKSVENKNKCFIIGGAQLFEKYWNTANYIYLTRIKHYASVITDDTLIKEKIYIQSIDTRLYSIVSVVDNEKYTWEIWKRKK